METPFKVFTFPADEIEVPPHRMRALDRVKAREIAESIKKVGQLSPIIVRRIGNGVELIAGLHRLEAIRLLESRHVNAFVVKCDDIEARKAEIAENLHRAELTVQERADHIAEWIRLAGIEKLAEVRPVSGGRGNEGGVRAASRDLGLKRTNVQQAIKIAGITTEAKKAAREAGLDDNQSALLKVAGVKTAEKQVEKVAEIVAARATPVDPSIIEHFRPLLDRWPVEKIDELHVWMSGYLIDRRAA